MSKEIFVEVLSNEKISNDVYKMVMESEYLAKEAKPGQFINIRCSDGLDKILRRPISIMDVDENNNTVTIAYKIAGSGTLNLSCICKGKMIDVVGPLGNPFNLELANGKKTVVIGGGVGIFPLLFLLKKLKEKQNNEASTLLGFRSSDYIILEDEFLNASNRLELSTDDGSRGYKGLITDVLEKKIADNNVEIIFACGPNLMLKKVAEISKKYSVLCQVSLEQRMGCGIGACLVCAVKIIKDGKEKMMRVCKDGPVFMSDEVVF